VTREERVAYSFSTDGGDGAVDSKGEQWRLVIKGYIPAVNKITPWSESASELYRPSDRRLSAKLVPTFCG
jgi:hypothetical protein